MKQLTIVVLVLLFAIVTKAQDTLSDNKNIQANNAQAAHFDYFLKIKGVDGDDSGPDSLPPAREHLTLNGGGIMSRTRNSNFIERYSVKSKPGFTISLGYTFEFPKSRLQINAGYQKGGVSVATGDISIVTQLARGLYMLDNLGGVPRSGKCPASGLE